MQQIRKGSLKELSAFVKDGAKAYRRSLLRGEKQPDGSEKLMLHDCRYVSQLSLLAQFQPATEELRASFETHSLVASILDDLIASTFG